MTNKAHVHAENMTEYAKDALTTDEPWKLWRYNKSNNDDMWLKLQENPTWYPDVRYMRIPKTIRIGEYDVPEPLRMEPKQGDIYWMDHPFSTIHVKSYTWTGASCDLAALSGGFIHSTKEAAEIHSKALRSFTEVKK